LLGVPVIVKEVANLLEYLFHDIVLTQVIVSSFELYWETFVRGMGRIKR
jgi:hypothetical protein